MSKDKKYKVSVYDKKQQKFVEYNNPNVQNVNKHNIVSTYKISNNENRIEIIRKNWHASVINSGNNNIVIYDSNTQAKISNDNDRYIKFRDNVFMKEDNKMLNRNNEFKKNDSVFTDTEILYEMSKEDINDPSLYNAINDEEEVQRQKKRN